MISTLAECTAVPVRSGVRSASRPGRDVLPLLLLGLLLGLACRGHFAKPHGDFYELRETGHALWRGELPPTFKRAPLYPLLLVAGGRLAAALGATETPPDLLAAGVIAAVLLPLSLLLACAIGRRWFGGGARWAAVWLALLPAGLYCTAEGLVEPALVAAVLLTIWLVQRGSGWGYVAAAAATMTRYDAAGVLLGVAVADLMRGRGWRRVGIRSGLAFLPLALWLVLTAATWQTRSADHYLRQIAEARQVDFGWPLEATLDVVFGADSLTLPVWLADWGPELRQGLRAAILAAALLGVVTLLRRRERGVLAALGMLAGYLVVHAVFPFRFSRFGYPPAAIVILLAGTGAWSAARWLAAGMRPWVRAAAVVVVLAALVVVACGEAGRVHGLLTLRRDSMGLLPLAVLLGVATVWATAFRGRRGMAAWLVAGAGLAALALLQLRLVPPVLGDGQERINVVRAARWVRDCVPADTRVLSDEPGILRLYADDRPLRDFVGLGDVVADDWPAILAECRRRSIGYIIWHDQVFAEQGAYYIRKWRLERFAALSRPESVPGVAVEMFYADRPTLWILRVLPG